MGGGNDYWSLYYKTPLSNSDHISKRRRFFKYPDPINPIYREVHAPCKQLRFINYKGISENLGSKMGNLSSIEYDEIKNNDKESGVCEKNDLDLFGYILKETDGILEIFNGLDSSRCLKKDEVVMNIDDDVDTVKESGSMYSSIEELEARSGQRNYVLDGSDSSRRLKKDEVVMNIDDDVDTVKESGSMYSSIEELEARSGQRNYVLDAFDSSRCLKKDEVVIHIDDVVDTAKEGGSEYSSIEEVERGSGKRNYVLDGCDSSRCSKKDTEVICVDDNVDTAKEGGSKDSSIEDLEARGGKRNELLDGFDDKVSNLKEGSRSIGTNPPRNSCLYAPLPMIFRSSVKKISDGLKSLLFQIEYFEKCREFYRLWRPQRQEHIKKDLIKKAFVPLSKEEKAEVFHALYVLNRKRVLVNHENSNIDLTGERLQCLRPRQWLNDEVINLYLELLKEREKREPEKFLKCHFFNTFFYKKLVSGKGGYNYQSVRRWTSQRKLGYSLFECDKIFVPIHQQKHWCLAVINKKDEKFQYLDSFRGRDTQVLKLLAKYFVDEVKYKNGKDIDVSSWKQEFVQDLPEQKNGFDCGMFMIKYADFYSRDIGLCFNQEHMLYFRQRTAMELLRLKAN